MPITVAAFNKANAQDYSDLIKIYSDDERFKSLSEIKTFLDQLQSSTSRTLYTARFNDRLLGAATVLQQQPSHWQITNICVREVTRRRRVATEILRQLCTIASSHKQTLWLELPSTFVGASSLLTELGFSYDANEQKWLVKPII